MPVVRRHQSAMFYSMQMNSFHALSFCNLVVIIVVVFILTVSSEKSIFTHLGSCGNRVENMGARHNATSNAQTNWSWCPYASCFDSAMCTPCQRRFLILICTGRSASTTLTWMIDALPGVRMAGENADTLHYLKNMKEGVMEKEVWATSAGNGRGAWSHNNVPPQSFSCVAQHMIETINPPKLETGKSLPEEEENVREEDDQTTIVGFKTIRFLSGPESDDNKLVEFIKNNFPCSKIVINYTSNITRQSNSAWYAAQEKNSSLSKLREANARLRKISTMFGPQAYTLDSAVWVKNISMLNEMVNWLGFSEKCHFASLLAFNVGGRGYEHGKTTLTLHRECQKLQV